MAVVRVFVVRNIQPAADVVVVQASQLGTPDEAVSGDDVVHMLVDDRNALDVVLASRRTAVDGLFPLMIPCQSVIDDADARLGEDSASDIESAIVFLTDVIVLLLVWDDSGTSTATMAVLVAARMDVAVECCQQVRVDSSQL